MWNFRSWINYFGTLVKYLPYHKSYHIQLFRVLFTLLATILKRKPYVTAWQHEDKWRKHFPRCGWWNVLSVRPGSAARTQEPVFLLTTPGVTTSTLPRHCLHDTITVWHRVSVTCFITTPHTGAAEDGWTPPCPMFTAQPPPATKQLFAVLAHSCTAPQCPTHHTKLLMTFHPPKQPVTACNHCVYLLYTPYTVWTAASIHYGPWPLHCHCVSQLLHLCL